MVWHHDDVDTWQVPVRDELRLSRRFDVPRQQKAAAARIDASDKARATYLRRYHGVRWDAASLYGLVLNTAQLSVDAAADVICLAATRIAGEGPAAFPGVGL